jgi:hypothetical protein
MNMNELHIEVLLQCTLQFCCSAHDIVSVISTH